MTRVAPKTGEEVPATKRKPLTRKQRFNLYLKQDGNCANCECRIRLARTALGEVFGSIDEHIIPLALGGSNDLSNRGLYCVPCAKAKTAQVDIPAIAKTKRLIAREKGERRPRKPIASKGFENNADKVARYLRKLTNGPRPLSPNDEETLLRAAYIVERADA
mgnify:CR=1 FL=1